MAKRQISAAIAMLALTGVGGCSTGGVMDILPAMPVQADAAPVSAEPMTEMGFAGPTVDGANRGPLAVVANVRQSFGNEPASPRSSLDGMIARYSAEYGVPLALVHRVVKRESTYNPNARNGGHYGLMQIKPETARTMGYRGTPEGLYDAETNLKYGVKYLRGAWLRQTPRLLPVAAG